MSKLPVALQVYSVREDAEKDFKGTMQKVKEMGYDGVELAGLYDMCPCKVKEILDEIGLQVVSAHVPYAELVEDMEGAVDKYVKAGCQYIAVPYLVDEMRPGTQAFYAVIDNIAKLGKVCAEKGIQLLYHNHDFEFVKMPDGSYGLDYLYGHVDADLLKTELDTCWVKVAGEDPAEYVRKYTGRAPVVHLKDFYREGHPTRMYQLIGLDEEEEKEAKKDGYFEFRPVGSGMQDIPSILAASVDAGAKWVVVEQDFSAGRTPMEAVKMSREYLKSLGW
ncbi:MAG: sugar phosphate isomerase/epimerase [Eubacteriales bacterium]|nr:sugar phosphate isomerase/epimerase [Eubacteriales bacterium]